MAVIRTILDQVNQNDIYLSDLTSTANLEYWGFAAPGSATSAAVWKIYVIDLNSDGRDTGKRWANASPAYAFIWNNRTSITYS